MESKFDGGLLGLIGVNIVVFFVTLINKKDQPTGWSFFICSYLR